MRKREEVSASQSYTKASLYVHASGFSARHARLSFGSTRYCSQVVGILHANNYRDMEVDAKGGEKQSEQEPPKLLEPIRRACVHMDFDVSLTERVLDRANPASWSSAWSNINRA